MPSAKVAEQVSLYTPPDVEEPSTCMATLRGAVGTERKTGLSGAMD